MFTPAKKLIKTLAKKGLATQAQIDEAIKAVGENDIDRYMIEKGYVEEKEILKIDAETVGCPYIDLTEFELDAKLIKIIPSYSLPMSLQKIPQVKDFIL